MFWVKILLENRYFWCKFCGSFCVDVLGATCVGASASILWVQILFGASASILWMQIVFRSFCVDILGANCVQDIPTLSMRHFPHSRPFPERQFHNSSTHVAHARSEKRKNCHALKMFKSNSQAAIAHALRASHSG